VTQGESLNNVERIISDLEKQREAIERAISALREIGDLVVSDTPVQPAASLPAQRKRRRLSAAGRRAISEATKKRWELKRAAESAAANKKAASTAVRRKAAKKSAAKRKAAAKGAAVVTTV
jgi:hypothetical protein